MIVANFTPEPIEWMHMGANGTLVPGKVEPFPDNRGRHILNKFGPRGLVELEFGDDVPKRQQDALKIYKAFWMRQVTIFNQDNERRKNTNREYVTPTKQLLQHAEELGIQLEGPWSIKQTGSAETKTLRDENLELRGQVGILMEQMKGLVDSLKARGEIPDALRTTAERLAMPAAPKEVVPEIKVDEKPPDNSVAELLEAEHAYSALIKEFQYLRKDEFSEWLMSNSDRVQAPDFPPAVRSMIKSKWERLIQGEWPLPA